jgi:MFS family permease
MVSFWTRVPVVTSVLLSGHNGAPVTTTTVSPPPTLPNQPAAGDLPGSSVLISLSNGLEGWALIAAVAGMVIGAVIWAFGNYSQNYQQAYNGRRGVLVSGLAALLVGGAPHLISFFLTKGQNGFGS